VFLMYNNKVRAFFSQEEGGMFFLSKNFCMSMKSKRSGFFIFVDMLVAVAISTICMLMIFKGFETANQYIKLTDELIDERGRITEILTSKEHYIKENHLQKDRTYEIIPSVFVDIYHVEYSKEIQNRYGWKKVEFGLIEERKGE